MSYPPDWRKCPVCGSPAMDGHFSCGKAQCDEGALRAAAAAYPLEDKCDYCGQHIGYITHPLGEMFRLGVCDKPECQEKRKKNNGTDLGEGTIEGYATNPE